MTHKEFLEFKEEYFMGSYAVERMSAVFGLGFPRLKKYVGGSPIPDNVVKSIGFYKEVKRLEKLLAEKG